MQESRHIITLSISMLIYLLKIPCRMYELGGTPGAISATHSRRHQISIVHCSVHDSGLQPPDLWLPQPNAASVHGCVAASSFLTQGPQFIFSLLKGLMVCFLTVSYNIIFI
jgi:hypothetical protein